MSLSRNIRTILLEDLALQIQQLKDKYVGEGKPLKDEEFQKIQDLSHGKFYILAWLTKKIGTNLLKSEDLYKWKEYIDIFEKNKKKFKTSIFTKQQRIYKTSSKLPSKLKKETSNMRIFLNLQHFFQKTKLRNSPPREEISILVFGNPKTV